MQQIIKLCSIRKVNSSFYFNFCY